MTVEQQTETNHSYYRLKYEFKTTQGVRKTDEIYIKYDSSINKWDIMRQIYQMQRVRYMFEFSTLRVIDKSQYTKEEFYSIRPTEYFQVEIGKLIEIIF